MFIGIAPGTIYYVKEEVNPEYQQMIPASANGYENKVVSDAVEVLPFVNEKIERKGMISISKLIVNESDEAPHAEDTFTFILRKKVNDNYEAVSKAEYVVAQGNQEMSYQTNEAGEFSIKGNETARFLGMSLQKEYQVEEKQTGIEYKIEESERIQEGKLEEQLGFTFTNRYQGIKVDLELLKANREKTGLAGAKFGLYVDEELLNQKGKDVVSDAAGKINIEDCKSGIYYLKEKESPTGYQLIANPIKIEIKTSEAGKTLVIVNNTEYQGKDHEDIYITSETGKKDVIHMTIYNDKNFGLPISGGSGILLMVGIGMLGMGGAYYGMHRSSKKKQS